MCACLPQKVTSREHGYHETEVAGVMTASEFRKERVYSQCLVSSNQSPLLESNLAGNNLLGVLARYNEKMGRMVSGIDSTYEELFAYACPKFITAAPPNLDAPGSNTNQVQSQPCCPLEI
jgi:hypothetical protein